MIDALRNRSPHAFPGRIRNRLGIDSHGVAMHLLEGANARFGVAGLASECFAATGRDFGRFSCAGSDNRLRQAAAFFAAAVGNRHRVERYLQAYPQYRRSSSCKKSTKGCPSDLGF